VPEGTNLSEMLAAGEIDAIYTAPAPDSFGRAANVVQLFPDFVTVEQEYFARTGIFPIMHVVAIKRRVWEEHPWIARSLMKAFDESLQIAYEDLEQRSALKVMLPWLQQHVRGTVEALGSGWWDYGIERNREVLDTFLRYSHAQGLAHRRWAPEDLFVPGVDDAIPI
jgi:4,5-dihydroxyphthalate decarboxylase